MKKGMLLFALFALMAPAASFAQTYFSKSATVSFDATAKNSPEDIKAKQASGTVVITEAGAVESAILIKSFLFKSALMQEHFNENYMESSKFPKTIFKGKVKDGDQFSLTKDGNYQVTVEGSLTMHGVTKQISAPVQIAVDKGKIIANADFSVKLADYGISVPSLVADKVSKEAKISVKSALTKK